MITWVVGKRLRHRGLSHDYLLALGSVALGLRSQCLPGTGRSFSLNILCWLEDYFIITSLFSLSFFARYSNPSFHPALPSLSLHHRLRFILHFWRCHSKESIKVSVIIRWINPLEQIQYHHIRLTHPTQKQQQNVFDVMYIHKHHRTYRLGERPPGKLLSRTSWGWYVPLASHDHGTWRIPLRGWGLLPGYSLPGRLPL